MRVISRFVVLPLIHLVHFCLPDCLLQHLFLPTKLEKMSTNVNEGNSVRTSSPYLSKKTIAQGMLDVALLSSHTSQLVQLFRNHNAETATTDESGFRTTAIVLLIISITLQIMVGILLITVGILDGQLPRAKRSLSKTINSVTIILIFVITAISVVIPSFTIGNVSPHHYVKPVLR